VALSFEPLEPDHPERDLVVESVAVVEGDPRREHRSTPSNVHRDRIVRVADQQLEEGVDRRGHVVR